MPIQGTVRRAQRYAAPVPPGLRPLAPALVVALLAMGAPAQAATVRVNESFGDEGTLVELIYSAAPGEANRLMLSQGPPAGGVPRIVVRDTGATVTAGDGCTATGPGAAICRTPVGDFDNGVTATLADGADVADAQAVRSASALLEGGTGPDQLRGSRSRVNALFGDTIAGQPQGAADLLTGGRRNDFLLGGPRNDMLDGRGGRDEASYRDERSRVFASLIIGRAEAPAHTDSLTAIESLEGGDGGDTLIGNARANTLTGEGGKDELRGNAGDDRLVGGGGGGVFTGGGSEDDTMIGGPGHDALFGERGADRMFGRQGRDRLSAGRGRDEVFAGRGNDRVNSRDGRRDRVRCGAGFDVVLADSLDLLFAC
jgi:Ca2+-binding RTX toxin-like protein